MRTGLLIAAIVASWMPVTAAAQTVPNPVRVHYGFRGADRDYNVDCWSTPGLRGTWQVVTGTTVTLQQALIHIPEPPSPPGSTAHADILYCKTSDGKPGTIAGAPAGLLLPPGSRVLVQRIALVKTGRTTRSIPLDEDTRVEAGPNGIRVYSGDRDLSIYPAGSTITVGGGQEVSYIRPGDKAMPSMQATPSNGCTVSYNDDSNGPARIVHYTKPCSELHIP